MSETVIYGKNGISSGSVVYGYGGLSSGTFIYDENTFATRNIPTFAGSQYGTIDTPITFTGDFEVEVEFASTDTALIGKGLFGYSIAGTTNFLQINNPAGQINFTNVDGAVAWSHANAHLDGKIHKVTVSRSGLTLGLKLDGVIKASNTLGVASTVDIDIIGALGIATIPSQFFNGQILSAKFTDAGTVVANYVFDSGSTTAQFARGSTTDKITLINFATTDWNRYTQQRNIAHDAGIISEAWVGDNVVVNGGFDTDTDWTKGTGWSISSGKATHAAGVSSDLNQDLSAFFVENDITLIKYAHIDYTAGATESIAAGAPPSVTNTGIGVFTRVATVGAFSAYGVRCSSTFDGSVDNISIKHLLEVA